MPSTNFELWNSVTPFTNAESDATYASDSTRTGGAVSGPFSPQLANKFFGQESIFTNAVIQMLLAAGFTTNDGNATPSTALATLTAVFTSAFILTNQAFFSVSPTAPTPALGDNSTKLATTQFINAFFTISTNTLTIGSVRLQWGTAVSVPSGGQSVVFSPAFGATPYVMLGNNGGSADIVNGTKSDTGFTLSGSGGNVDWFAIGPK